METLTLTLKKVKKLIKRKQFHIHSIRPKDQPGFPSAVWKTPVFHMVYDVDKTLVRSFYYCTLCSELIHLAQTGSGNSKLTRHGCYKKYLMNLNKGAKDKGDSSSSSDDSNNDSSSDEEQPVVSKKANKKDELATNNESLTKDQFNLLAKVFAEFRILCLKSECLDKQTVPADFMAILPKIWSIAEWNTFIKQAYAMMKPNDKRPAKACPKSLKPAEDRSDDSSDDDGSDGNSTDGDNPPVHAQNAMMKPNDKRPAEACPKSLKPAEDRSDDSSDDDGSDGNSTDGDNPPVHAQYYQQSLDAERVNKSQEVTASDKNDGKTGDPSTPVKASQKSKSGSKSKKTSARPPVRLSVRPPTPTLEAISQDLEEKSPNNDGEIKDPPAPVKTPKKRGRATKSKTTANDQNDGEIEDPPTPAKQKRGSGSKSEEAAFAPSADRPPTPVKVPMKRGKGKNSKETAAKRRKSADDDAPVIRTAAAKKDYSKEDRAVHDLTTGRRSLTFSAPESSSTFIFNRSPVQVNLNETWLDGAAGLDAQSQFLDPNRITQSHHGGSVVDHYHFDPFEAAEETYSVLTDKSIGNLSVEREKTDGKSDDQLIKVTNKEPTEADKTTDTANGNPENATDPTANNLTQSQQPPNNNNNINNNNNNDRNNDASNPENAQERLLSIRQGQKESIDAYAERVKKLLDMLNLTSSGEDAAIQAVKAEMNEDDYYKQLEVFEFLPGHKEIILDISKQMEELQKSKQTKVAASGEQLKKELITKMTNYLRKNSPNENDYPDDTISESNIQDFHQH
ncbi:nucleolar protein dao-5-like, partial [Sitodiplosis mosellana]|uniref:nucleolar protein dao-5-like n=1 Tax=Sitodiplosis mosellana TaxID=263140 RepID=UPI002443C290